MSGRAVADRGPPRNAALTRVRILEAAHRAFSHAGYAQVGLREIAAQAGVTSALVVRYFGTKLALFEAALVWTLEHRGLFTYDKAGFGARMAALVGERGHTDITIMLVLALSDPDTHDIATQIARDRMIRPLADWLGAPRAEERAMNLFGLLTGFTIQIRALGDGAAPPACLDWFARTLQAIVDDG